ncbi:adenine phosphoribosyltransferase [Limibacter armeniacum]|uniref:adenine phosphoribosyltransferase n=1 Tax=Limibacter armeniacum TaxID=466084 RepID=UPI002FE50AD8
MSFDITSYIRDIHDFPKDGILFKDITPVLSNPKALTGTVEALLKMAEGLKVDKVVAMESRGFMFGTLLAARLGAGFVPVRKPGKLPFSTLKEEYALEYGTDALEMHTDAIQEGDHVLIHDDVLATGGTAEATVKLVERAGGKVVQLSFLMDLLFLNGRDRLQEYEVKSLVSY